MLAVTHTTAAVAFSFDVNYSSVISNSTVESQFKETVTTQLSVMLGVDRDRIANLSIREGSILVSFVLLSGGASEPNVSHALSFLQAAVTANKLSVVLQDGRKLFADAGSLSVEYTMPTTVGAVTTVASTDNSSTQDDAASVAAHVPATVDSANVGSKSDLSTAALVVITVSSVFVGLLLILSIALHLHKGVSSSKDTFPPEELEKNGNEVVVTRQGKETHCQLSVCLSVRTSLRMCLSVCPNVSLSEHLIGC